MKKSTRKFVESFEEYINDRIERTVIHVVNKVVKRLDARIEKLEDASTA